MSNHVSETKICLPSAALISHNLFLTCTSHYTFLLIMLIKHSRSKNLGTRSCIKSWFPVTSTHVEQECACTRFVEGTHVSQVDVIKCQIVVTFQE